MSTQSYKSSGYSSRYWIGWALLAITIVAATGELAFRGFRRALVDLQDLSVIYDSARAFETGRNPYDYAAMHAASVEAGRSEPVDPNPENLAVYPPTTYLLLAPLASLNWNSVHWAWILINLIAIALLLIVFTQYAAGKMPAWKIACGIAFILGFGPIHTAIAKGQLAVIVTALLALAFIAQARNRTIAAAIFVSAAACLKPQMVAPVLLLYLFQKRWKAIAMIAAVISGLLCIAWVRLAWAGVPWLTSLLRNVSVEMKPGGVYDASPSNPLVFQLVNASTFFQRLTINQTAITVLLGIIALSVCFFLWKRGQQSFDLFADPIAFGTACVLGLVVLSHRYYDAAVLVFVFAWALRDSSGQRRFPALFAIVGCLIMAFPLPALLIVSGHAHAPALIPQTFWDAIVVQHESWVLLVVLFAATTSLVSRAKIAIPRAAVAY